MSNSKQQKPQIITETDPETGIVTREQWRKNGKLDRADGPAYIERDPETGLITLGAWYKDGKHIPPPDDYFLEEM